MKTKLLAITLLLITTHTLRAQTPTLGTYPATTVLTAGDNAIVTPSVAPANTTSIVAYTTTRFKGTLHVNPATGVLNVTNAHPAGTYTITIKAFNGAVTTTTNCTVTVGGNVCSQGFMNNVGNLAAGSSPNTVAVADFNSDGNHDLALTNYNSGTVSIRLGNGGGGFTGTLNIGMGLYSGAMEVADLNGDGKQDLVVCSSFGNTLSIRLGDGTGNFGALSTLSTGEYPRSVAVGDFNKDGKSDLAIAAVGNVGFVALKMGDGTGGFTNGPNAAVTGTPQRVALGDFNNDGNIDLAVSQSSTGGQGGVAIRLGDGTGNFSGTYNTGVNTSDVQSVAMGDMNGDGNQDLITTTFSSGSSVYVSLGNGVGFFSFASSKFAGNNPNGVIVADFNGDGKQDVATPNYSGNNIAVLLGDGTGGLGDVFSLSVTGFAATPSSLAAGDFNEDGVMDMAVANAATNGGIAILQGRIAEMNVRGNGSDIADGSTLPSTTNHTDFGNVSNRLTRTFTIQNTGDGNLTVKNIFISGADATLFERTGITLPATILPGATATFTIRFTPQTSGLKKVTINILNDDCDENIYDFAIQGNAVAVVPVLGAYNSAATVRSGGNLLITPSAAPANAINIVAGVSPNFKGQLTVDSITGIIKIINANPAGTFTAQVKAFNGFSSSTTICAFTVANPVCSNPGGTTNLPVTGQPREIAIADFNADGKQDFAFINSFGSNISLRYGNDSANFTNGPVVAVSATALTAGDVNGDGRPDLLVASSSQNLVTVLLATMSGGFINAGTFAVGIGPNSIAIADFNSDGKPDFLASNYSGNSVSVRMGDLTGSFSGGTDIAIGGLVFSTIVGDFNGDGKADFATANGSNSTLSVRLGDGAGNFTARPNISLPSNASQLVMADFNGDSKQDLAWSNTQANSISVRLGDGTGNFSGTTNIPLGQPVFSIAIADYNGDGKPDIIAGHGTMVSIRLGDGAGNFSGTTALTSDAEVRAVTISDFNNDGRQDLAITYYRSSPLSEYIGIRPGGENDANIRGNNVNIPDGSNIPLVSNHTDFGTGGNVTRIFTIQNTGGVNLNIQKITISGVDSALFTISAKAMPITIAPGSSDTFRVSFLPQTAGQKNAVVTVYTDDCDKALYDFAISGTALSAVQGTYPATVIAAAGGNTIVTPSILPINATSFTATTSANFKGLLQIDSATGNLTVINAYPEGNYTVTVKAFNNQVATTTSFSLRVNSPVCSQGLLTGTNISLGAGNSNLIAVADFNNDLRQDLVLGNSAFSTSIVVSLGNGNGGFSTAPVVDIGVVPSGIAVGDFNGDGRQDFAVTNTNDFLVRIRLGNGAGGFSAAPNVLINTYATAMVVADFNNDGKLDIATSNSYTSSNIGVLLGNGLGGFTAGPVINLTNSPGGLVAADFNNDGKPDLAVLYRSSGAVGVLTGNGAGGFAITATVAVGQGLIALITADFNNDGTSDFATANTGTNNVTVQLNNGAGSFTAAAASISVTNPQGLATADFNGDGRQDVVVAAYNAAAATICLGLGNGSFTDFSNVATTANPQNVVTGDFNGDGRQDFATANGSGTVTIASGAVNDINVKGGNLSIPDGSTLPTVANNTDFGNVGSSAIRTFTIQNTGQVKLIVSAISLSGADSASFYLYGTPLPATILAGDSLNIRIGFVPAVTGSKTTRVIITSNDCDEAVYDIALQATGVVTSPTLGTYTSLDILAAGGNAIVSPSAPPTNTENITATAPAQFKGLLQVDSITGAVRITNAHPAGTYTISVKVNGLSPLTRSFVLTVGNTSCSQALFSGNTNIFASSNPNSLQTADFNNDGKQDIIYGGSGDLIVRLGNGAGGFGTDIRPSFQYLSIYSIATGDFNGDGNLDVAATIGGRKTYIFLGNGTGNLLKVDEIITESNISNLATADFDGDGRLDMALSAANNTVIVYKGNGAGGFSYLSQTPTGTFPRVIVVADFNNDGYPDFAVNAQNSNTVSVRLGTGTGSFVGNYEVAANNPLSVSTGDYNGDGNVDIAISNYVNNAGLVAVRFGDGAGSFSGTTSFAASGVANVTSGGDLNGDGNTDIMIANSGSGAINIQLGNGAGGFTSGPSVAVGGGPVAVAIGDFNGDGRQDFASANQSGSTISIRLGSGNEINVRGNNIDIPDSSRATAPSNFTDFENVSSSLVRTFTIQNTGLVALTVSNINFSGGDFSSFVAGGISLPATIAAGASTTFTVNFIPTSTGLKTATITIFNNDCDEALYDFAIQGTGVAVTPTLGSYPATAIAAAGGNAIITPSTAPTNANQISAYTTADFKGLLQVNPITGAIIVTNAHPAGIYEITVKVNGIVSTAASFLLTVNNAGCSQGLFSGTTNTALSNYNYAIAVGDFNSDGRQDFASTNYLNNSVSIGLGDGAGNFSAATNVSVGTSPRSIAISDFNNDGKQDFATGNYNTSTVSIRLGNGAGGFTGTVNLPVGTTPQAIVTADFNRDGKPDFATANYNANNVTVYFGDGAGSFYGRSEVPVGTNPVSLAINDFNNDGNADFAAANYISNTVSIRLGDGLGGFNTVLDVVAGSTPISVTTADFNKDGKQDMAVANYGNGFANTFTSVRLGDGAGSFTNAADIDFGSSPLSIVAGDFNGDRNADLAGVYGFSGNVAIRPGNGAGGFTAVANVLVGESPRGIAIGDFNGDGRQDIATANNSASNVTVRLNSDREMNLLGNNSNIADGSNAPAVSNFTDFGSVPVGSSSVRTYTIQNTGTSNLLINSIRTSGADSALFAAGGISLPLTVAARSATTFTLTFTSTGNGVKTTRINIVSNDCDETVYDFVVRGAASCSPSSTTNIWLGTTADWNAAGNWSLNFVPSECTRVVVNAGVPFMPEITSPNSACYRVTINNGATVTVKNGGHLNITANNQ